MIKQWSKHFTLLVYTQIICSWTQQVHPQHSYSEAKIPQKTDVDTRVTPPSSVMRDFAKVEPLTKPLHLNESSGTFTLYNAPKSEITLSLNRDSFRGVIFCHKIQASTMRRGYIYKIHPRECRSLTVFDRPTFSSRVNFSFYLCPLSPTLRHSDPVHPGAVRHRHTILQLL